jgi:hypothetical protein
MITKERANELFVYKNNDLYWKINKGTAKAGSLVGSFDNGYRRTSVDGKLYLVHRIIFFMAYGYFPKFVDHKDGNTLNNSLENLREATRAQNNSNAQRGASFVSGAKGVGWHKHLRKWRVRVSVKNKSITVGYFDDLDLAQLVAIEARNKYHGNFANHG